VRLLPLKSFSIPLNSTVTFVLTFFKSLLIFHKNRVRFLPLHTVCHATESNATIKYKQITNTTQLMILLRLFLHRFFQRHVSALVMSHLQVDYFFLVKQDIQLAMLLLLKVTMYEYTLIKSLSELSLTIICLYFIIL
jgi:hypothetical protein